jgi:deazaflavin-dependent oxidoreductase (nitroreductase family)
MNASTTAAQARKRAPLLVRMMNPFVRPLLRSPLHGMMSGRLILLTYTGRQSGKQYSHPVGYAQVDENTLMVGTQNRWWHNVRGGGQVKVRLRGVDRQAHAEPITDLEGVIEGFRQIATASPAWAKTLANSNKFELGPDGQAIRDDLVRAHQRGFVVVRMRLA